MSRLIAAPASERSRRAVAVICVSLALLLQSLAPPGYMAGSLDGGWPVVLCPEGLPAGFLAHGEHAHHHETAGAGEDVSLDGHCPLGSVMDTTAGVAALPSEHRLPEPGSRTDAYAAPARLWPLLSPPSRAPPA